MRQAIFDEKLCEQCEKEHGKIYSIEQFVLPWLHLGCRCFIVAVVSIQAGTATEAESQGADYALLRYGKLPTHYILKETARALGWKQNKGNLASALPCKHIGGNVYYNDDRRLPEASGRVWREADINYQSGFRNTERILYSNDGLIFVTYDHYRTFSEIVREV